MYSNVRRICIPLSKPSIPILLLALAMPHFYAKEAVAAGPTPNEEACPKPPTLDEMVGKHKSRLKKWWNAYKKKSGGSVNGAVIKGFADFDKNGDQLLNDVELENFLRDGIGIKVNGVGEDEAARKLMIQYLHDNYNPGPIGLTDAKKALTELDTYVNPPTC